MPTKQYTEELGLAPRMGFGTVRRDKDGKLAKGSKLSEGIGRGGLNSTIDPYSVPLSVYGHKAVVHQRELGGERWRELDMQDLDGTRLPAWTPRRLLSGDDGKAQTKELLERHLVECRRGLWRVG